MKPEIKFWDDLALNTNVVRNKRVHHRQTPGSNTKKQKPSKGHGTVLGDGSMDPAKFIVQRAPLQLIAFEHVGYYGRWPKVAKSF